MEEVKGKGEEYGENGGRKRGRNSKGAGRKKTREMEKEREGKK